MAIAGTRNYLDYVSLPKPNVTACGLRDQDSAIAGHEPQFFMPRRSPFESELDNPIFHL